MIYNKSTGKLVPWLATEYSWNADNTVLTFKIRQGVKWSDREPFTAKDISVHGEVPVLIDPPPGCPFASRCGKVRSICRKEMQEVIAINAGHWTRCYLYETGHERMYSASNVEKNI